MQQETKKLRKIKNPYCSKLIDSLRNGNTIARNAFQATAVIEKMDCKRQCVFEPLGGGMQRSWLFCRQSNDMSSRDGDLEVTWEVVWPLGHNEDEWVALVHNGIFHDAPVALQSCSSIRTRYFKFDAFEKIRLYPFCFSHSISSSITSMFTSYQLVFKLFQVAIITNRRHHDEETTPFYFPYHRRGPQDHCHHRLPSGPTGHLGH